MLIGTELAEVMEEYRTSGFDALGALDVLNVSGKPVGIASEFADVLIRIADTCGRYSTPLDQALVAKLAYNKTRSYRHGDKHA